jgi:hypothetical protein
MKNAIMRGRMGRFRLGSEAQRRRIDGTEIERGWLSQRHIFFFSLGIFPNCSHLIHTPLSLAPCQRLEIRNRFSFGQEKIRTLFFFVVEKSLD